MRHSTIFIYIVLWVVALAGTFSAFVELHFSTAVVTVTVCMILAGAMWHAYTIGYLKCREDSLVAHRPDFTERPSYGGSE
jgi:hypothetical protein